MLHSTPTKKRKRSPRSRMNVPKRWRQKELPVGSGDTDLNSMITE